MLLPLPKCLLTGSANSSRGVLRVKGVRLKEQVTVTNPLVFKVTRPWLMCSANSAAS